MNVTIGGSRWAAAALVVAATASCSSSSTGPGSGGGIALKVGGVAMVSQPQQLTQIRIGGTGGPSEYLIIAANADTAPDVSAAFMLASSGTAQLVAASGFDRASHLFPQRQAVSRVLGRDVVRRPPINMAQLRFEGRVRAYERAHLHFPRGGLRGFRSLSKGVSARCVPSQQPEGVCPTPVAPVPGTVVPGTMVSLHVPVGPNDLCTQYASTNAVVRAVSTHAIIVEDTLDAQAGATFTLADFQSIATEFDNFIYPTDQSHFGTPTDIDNNGHVILFYTAQVNKLTVPGESGFVGGFFFNGDLFPDTNVTVGGNTQMQCAESNYAEIFYLLAPDPNSVFSSVAHPTAEVRQLTRGTVAHEFQHMINAGNRLYNCSACLTFEETWLDEALAHSAEDWVGRAEDGFGDAQQLTFADVTGHGSNDFNAFFFQNAARYGAWLGAPSTYGTIDTLVVDTSLSTRGAVWSLVEYSADQYAGSAGIAAFTHALAAGPETGVDNLTVHAGVPLDVLLQGWLIANFASGDSISGLPAKYLYTGYNMRDVQDNLNSGTYPLAVMDASPGATLSAVVKSGTGAYYTATTSGNAFTIKLTASGGGAPPATARVYIVRLQ